MKTLIEITEGQNGWEARFVRKPFKLIGRAKKPKEAVVDLFSKMHARGLSGNEMSLSERKFIKEWAF